MAATLTDQLTRLWQIAECSANIKGNLVREMRLMSWQGRAMCAELHLRAVGRGHELDVLRYENERFRRRNADLEEAYRAADPAGRGETADDPEGPDTLADAAGEEHERKHHRNGAVGRRARDNRRGRAVRGWATEPDPGSGAQNKCASWPDRR